jgi:hypothetical protein
LSQHLAALAERRRRHRFELFQIRRRDGCGQGVQTDDGRGHRWRRHESAAIHIEQDFGPGPPGGEDGQAAIMLAARTRRDALRHFALKHQGKARPEGRPTAAGQPFDQQSGTNIVRQV